MTDDTQRRGLLADIPRHLAPLGLDALRIADAFVMGLLLHERAHGPIALETLGRQPTVLDPRDPTGSAIAATIQCIAIGLAQQDRERAELQERARDEMFGARAAGDEPDTGPIAVAAEIALDGGQDADAPAATYAPGVGEALLHGPAIRVVVDDPGEPDELGGGDA